MQVSAQTCIYIAEMSASYAPRTLLRVHDHCEAVVLRLGSVCRRLKLNIQSKISIKTTINAPERTQDVVDTGV